MRGDDPWNDLGVIVATREFPACAGMIRHCSVRVPRIAGGSQRVPRMRGDDPFSYA